MRSRVTLATAGNFAKGIPDELEAGVAVGPRQIAGLRVATFHAIRRNDGVTLAAAGGIALQCACALRSPG